MKEKDRRLIRVLGVLSTVGIAMVAATVIGFYFGRFLDARFGTGPWLTIIFLVLGIVAGFRNLYQSARRAQQEMDRQDNPSQEGKNDDER
jgi:ATP synthase protein I